METTINTTRKQSTHTHAGHKGTAAFWESLEFNRFGIISVLVVIIGCSGGIAASFGAGDSILKLAMIAFPSIISLALILAVAPMRAICYVALLAIVCDLLIFTF